MRRLFKGALLICLAALMAACENATMQQEENNEKIQISLLFSIGNSPLSIGGPMTGTKGAGESLFDAIYEGIVSGEIIASYELTFKNINTGGSTSISGKWTDNKIISLEKGTYTIYGISTAVGKGIYKDCSLSYQDEVTITPETRSITIKAQYDCSLLIVNDDSVDKILYYASQTDSTYFSQYHNLTYAFVKSAEDFTQGNNVYLKVYFKNGRSSIVDLGQINIQKGKYYLLENLNNYADAGLVLDIDKMENGDDSNKTISLDGRWDGVPEGTQVGTGEQRITLIFDGNKVDVYIVAWGDHLKGTYTYENDKLNFSFKNEDAYDARMYTGENSWGWNFADGALNPETLELSYTETMPYQWYPMYEGDFEMDIDYLKDFTFKMVDDKKAVGGPMYLEFIKRCDMNDKNEGDDNTVAKPIVFSVMGGSSTGASSSINSYIANNGGFKVWGFKKVNTSSADWTTVFDGTTISSSDYGSTWTYSPLRYWDKTASYTFVAVSPNANIIRYNTDNTGKFVTANAAGYTLVGQNLQSTTAPNQDEIQFGFNDDTDLMTSDKVIRNGTNGVTGDVNLQFKHILAKLNVAMAKDPIFDNVKVLVKSVKITGLDDTGTYAEPTSNTASGWSSSSTNTNYTLSWENANGVELPKGTGEGDSYQPGKKLYFIESLFMPQSIEEKTEKLVVDYTIESDTHSERYNYTLYLNDGEYKVFNSFTDGINYTIKLTVRPNIITFDATTENWNYYTR